MEKKKYSVVIPVYNSSAWIEELVSQIEEVLTDIGVNYEIILVNDRSPELVTWSVLKKVADVHANVKCINLQYNSGQFNALLCGMKFAGGDYVITMDDDFQHQPKEIRKLILGMNETHYDCIIGEYAHKEHNIIRRLGSKLANWLAEKIYKKPKGITSNSFRILKHELAEVLVNYKGKKPQIGPMIFSATKNIGTVTIEHSRRKYGKSGYHPLRLISETFSIITNASTIPLDLVSIGGFCVAGISFAIGFVYLILYLTRKTTVPGFTAQILVTTFFSGVILLSIGMVGKYVGKIVQELIGFPPYMVEEFYEGENEKNETFKN